MYPNEQPDRHPIQERRAQDGGRVLGEQNDLENGRLQAGLEAVVDVARKVAQEVHVKNIVVALAGIQPDGEDESFRGRFMAPESVAASPRRGFWSVETALEANMWDMVSVCRRVKTYRVPAGMWKVPSSLVMVCSTPFLATANTPCSTLKYSSCKR